jgi:hypothetical protein
MLESINRMRNKKRAEKLRDKLRKYDKEGYRRELLDNSKLVWSIFVNDFEVGDKITWLGHDGVYGLLYDQEIDATQEEVDFRKKGNYNFAKKVDELNFEPVKNF